MKRIASSIARLTICEWSNLDIIIIQKIWNIHQSILKIYILWVIIKSLFLTSNNLENKILLKGYKFF